ncbi:MAG: AMP-binding protein [Proteobacteria bacterium]|nr:AMP-binding protein [Pseudomonadota bacterium]MDA1299301.1 AMP-binding protein [Pseudomonadota bacterium]
MTLIHQLLSDAAARFSTRVAIDSPGGQLTYRELQERADFLAGALEDLGMICGDTLAILSPNCGDYLVCQYAASRIGAIFEVLNTRHVTDELVYAVNNAGARTLIVHQDLAGHVGSLRACPTVEWVIGLASIQGAHWTFDELIARGTRAQSSPPLSDDSPAVLMYTSGTTGRPKGALQTQRGSVQADQTTASLLEVSEHDRFLAFMPFFHQAGLIRARAMLSRGATIVMPGDLSADDIADYLRRQRVTVTMLVPPYSVRLLSLCEQQDIKLPDLRMLIGATGIRVKSFCEANGCRCMSVYGQTEVTGLITVIWGEESWGSTARSGSVGRPVDDMEIRIQDDDGRELPHGETGEIMARSARCVPGYWQNDQASAALYSDGWLHTGDLGRVDDDGYLYFVGRKKELIKTGGENVYPLEVENVLRRHEDVLDLTVMGLPDRDWGEAVTAVIVTRSGQTLSANDFHSFCRGQLAGYKAPRRVYCVDEIPRNHTGKPDKLALRQRFLADRITRP